MIQFSGYEYGRVLHPSFGCNGKWGRGVEAICVPDYETTEACHSLVVYLATNIYVHCGVTDSRNNVNANLLLFDYSIRRRVLRVDVNTI